MGRTLGTKAIPRPGLNIIIFLMCCNAITVVAQSLTPFSHSGVKLYSVSILGDPTATVGEVRVATPDSGDLSFDLSGGSSESLLSTAIAVLASQQSVNLSGNNVCPQAGCGGSVCYDQLDVIELY